MTKDRIAEAAKIEEDNAKKEVLSLAETFEEIENVEAITSRNEAFAPVKKAFVGLKGEDVSEEYLLRKQKVTGAQWK